jgi:hypothetical protein
MPRLAAVLVASGTLILVQFGSVSATTAATSRSTFSSETATQIVSTGRTATMHAGSMTGTLANVGTGESLHQTQDSGKTDGQQLNSTSVGGVIQVRVIGSTTYFMDNLTALRGQFGNGVSAKYANRWISVKPGELGYSTITAAVTLPSLLTELIPNGPLSKTSVATFAGHQCIGVWTSLRQPAGATGRQTLWVETAAPHLIAGMQVLLTSGSQHRHVSFVATSWGRPVKVAKPTGAVSITKTTL